jgi:hypothetical protein
MDDVIFEVFKGNGNLEIHSIGSSPTAACSRRSTSRRAARGRKSC